MPPEQTKLAVLKWKTGTANGVPQYRRILALVGDAEEKDDTARYWIGCRQHASAEEISVTPAEPSLASLADTQRIERTLEREGFGTYADLALAVQSAARGWNDLAQGLLVRSRQGPQDPFSPRRSRPANHRAALATLAWNYWCEEFCTERDDRAYIVERLAQLQRGPLGLDSQAHKNVVEDVRKTLAPTESPPESVESIIDSMIDLGIEGGWRGRGLASLSSAGRSESYRKLQGMGLDAVPVLLKHTHDFRMTRCVQTDNRGTWHVRIADVVRELLNGLVPEEFAYDFLIREGRGKCVDRTHVLHWWMNHPQGVPLLVDELGAIPKTPKQPYWQSTAGRFAQLVCYTDDPRVWSALVENAKRVDIGQRLEMIQAVGSRSGHKDDRVIEFLAAFLDDEEARVASRIPNFAAFDDPKDAFEKLTQDLFSGPSAGFTFERLPVRDFAALQLAHKLGVKAGADSSWKESDWEALRTRVRDALAKRKP